MSQNSSSYNVVDAQKRWSLRAGPMIVGKLGGGETVK